MALEKYQSEFTAEELENAIRAVPKIGANGNWFIGDNDTGVFAGGVKVEGAEVGQTIVVKAVDENGKPTEWKAASFPGRLLNKIKLTEEVSSLTFSTDDSGKPYNLRRILIHMTIAGGANNETTKTSYRIYPGESDTAATRRSINGVGTPTSAVRSTYDLRLLEPTNLIVEYGTGDYNAATKAPLTFGSHLALAAIKTINLFCETSGCTFGIGSMFVIWGEDA